MVQLSSATSVVLLVGAVFWCGGLWLLVSSTGGSLSAILRAQEVATEKAHDRGSGSPVFRLPVHSAVPTASAHGMYYFTNPPKSKMGAFFESRGFLRTTDIHAASLIWFQNKHKIKKAWGTKRKAWRELGAWQKINHLEKEFEIGHKGRLLFHLHQYFDGPGTIPFMPASYRLWDPEERNAFLDAIRADAGGDVPDTSAREGNRIGGGVNDNHEINGLKGASSGFRPWIMKQAHMDNGQGIQIISQPQKLAELATKLRAIPGPLSSSSSSSSSSNGALPTGKIDPATMRGSSKSHRPFYRHLIAQRYLLRPLLTVDGHKFDLRMYWLVATVSPLVVFYHDGYMRVSMSRYSEKDFKLRTALTNAEVAKQGTDSHGKHDYEASKESTRRPFSDLRTLVGGTSELNALRCKIQNALADIVAAAKVAVFDHAAANGCIGCFALMGADFMVGHDGGIYMSEVQSGPGLPMTTATTKAFFLDILPNAIDLVLEIQDRRAAGMPLWPLDHLGGFSVIVHEGKTEVEQSATLAPACAQR